MRPRVKDIDVRVGEATLEQTVEFGGHIAHVVKRDAENQSAIGVLTDGLLKRGLLDQPVVDKPVIVVALLPETDGLIDRVGVVVVQVLPARQACDLLTRRIEASVAKLGKTS